MWFLVFLIIALHFPLQVTQGSSVRLTLTTVSGIHARTTGRVWTMSEDITVTVQTVSVSLYCNYVKTTGRVWTMSGDIPVTVQTVSVSLYCNYVRTTGRVWTMSGDIPVTVQTVSVSLYYMCGLCRGIYL